MSYVRRLALETTDATMIINYYPESDIVMVFIGTFITKAAERNQVVLVRLVAEDETKSDIHCMNMGPLAIHLDHDQIAQVSHFLELKIISEC